MNHPPIPLKIPLELVTSLISEQFPHWAHLPITPIPFGIDNKTFRLGDSMSIRIPSAEGYASQVKKEQKYLPLLAPHLPFPIPEPLVIGQPSKHYPFHWSINRWLPGETAESLLMSNQSLDLDCLAPQLAQFLNALQKISSLDGPLPGLHNYYRGASPEVYDGQTRLALSQLKDVIDFHKATSLWEKALNSNWTQTPVWIHGDFSPGNILIKDNRLSAIIDFGCMGIGDPACDLVIAWTLLTDESRRTFKSILALDPQTWARARGWALWKASINLVSLKNKTGLEAQKNLQIIDLILTEDRQIH